MSEESTPNGNKGEAIDSAHTLGDDSTKAGIEQVLQSPLTWDTDPHNPVNWSSARKWTVVTLLWATCTIAHVSLPHSARKS